MNSVTQMTTSQGRCQVRKMALNEKQSIITEFISVKVTGLLDREAAFRPVSNTSRVEVPTAPSGNQYLLSPLPCLLDSYPEEIVPTQLSR